MNEQLQAPPKFPDCRDCRFYRENWLNYSYLDRCISPKDVVFERGKYTYSEVARTGLVVNSCGPTAKHFEPKPPSPFSKFISFIRRKK